VANRIQGILHLKRWNAKDLARNAKDFERGPVFSGLCAERPVFGFQRFTDRRSTCFVAPTKQCASTGEMRQLEIDSLDQNRLQLIEKIQNLLPLTLLNVKYFGFN
jgi:hypothetical protein